MSRKIPFPGYEQLCPCYPAVKNLWRLAGEQDSSFQASQISVSFLENFIKTYNLDRSDFVKKLSELFHISGGHHDWETTKKIMARSYIVQTYNLQEFFFKDFINELRVFKRISTWETVIKDGNTTKNLDPFAQLIQNTDKNVAKKYKDVPEVKLIQYYRLIRNAVVHNSKDALNKPNDYFIQNIQPIKEYFNNYFKFTINDEYPAPNPPTELNNYDFSIYSRSLRYFSYLINDAYSLTGQEIFDTEIQKPEFAQSLTFYNYRIDKNLKSKVEKKLVGYFKTHYSKRTPYIEEFCTAYFNWYENRFELKERKERKTKK